MTSYSNNVNVGTATGNYALATGTGTFLITPATATCSVSHYNVTFDGASHTASTAGCTVGAGASDDRFVSGLESPSHSPALHTRKAPSTC